LAGPVAAADLTLTKAEATPLTSENVGKPFWSLQAQCAGAFGAGYAYERAHDRDKRSDADKAAGVAMLENAIARLEVDRGIDRASAINIAIPEVEYGRNFAKAELDQEGSSASSSWNYLRSACIDIDAAARNHLVQ
jgi:hypothetical protein